MKRLHVHIAVADLAPNIEFYSTLFGQPPTVVKADYAKWSLEDPRVNFAISTRAARTGLDHLGIQVEEEGELEAVQARLEQAGMPGEVQAGTACCYARSDKYWTADPQGIAWEAFHTLASVPTFNEQGVSDTSDGACCTPPDLSGQVAVSLDALKGRRTP